MLRVGGLDWWFGYIRRGSPITLYKTPREKKGDEVRRAAAQLELPRAREVAEHAGPRVHASVDQAGLQLHHGHRTLALNRWSS